MHSLYQNTTSQEQAISDFLRDFPNKPNDGHTIYEILSDVCGYYDADRSCIFELNTERTHISNTYEWHRDGVSAAIGNLQNISVEVIDFRLNELEEKLYISSLQDKFDSDSMTYQLLKRWELKALRQLRLQ